MLDFFLQPVTLVGSVQALPGILAQLTLRVAPCSDGCAHRPFASYIALGCRTSMRRLMPHAIRSASVPVTTACVGGACTHLVLIDWPAMMACPQASCLCSLPLGDTQLAAACLNAVCKSLLFCGTGPEGVASSHARNVPSPGTWLDMSQAETNPSHKWNGLVAMWHHAGT